MKINILSLLIILSFGVWADDHLPTNFSKYQSNFHFKCDEPEKCFAAFDKYMKSPEVSGLEVDFYALNHNGFSDASHGISFYFKDADEYAATGNFYATSKAGKDFRNAMNRVGADLDNKTLTIHSVGVVDGVSGTAESPVGLIWDLNVSDPAAFVPTWVEFSKNMEEEAWNKATAYGLQTHYLGNVGNGITHNVWAQFKSQQDALEFLDGMYSSPEFAEYSTKAKEYRTFLRSYMTVSLKMYNPD